MGWPGVRIKTNFPFNYSQYTTYKHLQNLEKLAIIIQQTLFHTLHQSVELGNRIWTLKFLQLELQMW